MQMCIDVMRAVLCSVHVCASAGKVKGNACIMEWNGMQWNVKQC